MQRLLLIFCLFVPSLGNTQYAQPTRIFSARQTDLQAGVGLFPTYPADNPETVVLPISLEVRRLITDQVSLDLSVGYSVSRSKDVLIYDRIRGNWLNRTILAGIRLGFHYTRLDDWDIYGGLSCAYQHVWISTDNPDLRATMRRHGIHPDRGRIVQSAFLGVRFALSPQVTVFGELGYGISLLKAGFGYRLLNR